MRTPIEHVAALADAADEWEISLRQANKSPATQKTYLTAVRQFDSWLTAHGHPEPTTRSVTSGEVRRFLLDILERTSPSTAITRHGGLQAFYKWCLREGLTTVDPTADVDKPRRDETVVPVLRDDDLRAVLKVCGTDFYGLRDAAIIRTLVGTGMRRGECANLMTNDVDPKAQTLHVVRGKGGRGRIVYLPDHAALALRRYERARKQHRLHDLPHLWLGKEGPFGGAGIQQMLQRRALEAGVNRRFNPHSFRHTFAHNWLARGGTEGSLMATAGWANRAMIDRYGRSVAAERAHAEAARLDIGHQL